MRDLSASLTDEGAAIPAGATPVQTSAPASTAPRLGGMRRGASGTILGIASMPARKSDAIDAAELERRLLEMGFVEGAHFEVLHEGPVGRDPICVRIDGMRVALRRRDANALLVAPHASSSRHHAA